MDQISEFEEILVRGVRLKLVTYTRALKLCALMNRENEILDFIDLIEPGEIFFDLGACEGRFALYAALRDIQCYAFEPEALNFRALVQNVHLNGDIIKRHLTPFKCAVGEKNRKAAIHVGQPWAGGHWKVIADVSGRVDLDFKVEREQEIDVVSLDSFIVTNALPQPNYLKVDIDGSELSFLYGSLSTLAHPELRGIIFELHQDDRNYEEVMSLLISHGFTEDSRHEVEAGLYNIVFKRKTTFQV